MFDTLSPPPHLRNLKWEPLAQSGAITTRVSSYKTKEIAVVANNFQRNIQRIKWMILVPSAVGDMTIRIQRCFDVAEFMITKTLDTTGADLSNRDEITALAQRLFHNSSQEELNKIGTAEWEDFIQIALERGTRPVLMIAAPLRQRAMDWKQFCPSASQERGPHLRRWRAIYGRRHLMFIPLVCLS